MTGDLLDLGFEVKVGELLGFAGRNGAAKTTRLAGRISADLVLRVGTRVKLADALRPR